jgi:hypothetical protein
MAKKSRARRTSTRKKTIAKTRRGPKDLTTRATGPRGGGVFDLRAQPAVNQANADYQAAADVSKAEHNAYMTVLESLAG